MQPDIRAWCLVHWLRVDFEGEQKHRLQFSVPDSSHSPDVRPSEQPCRELAVDSVVDFGIRLQQGGCRQLRALDNRAFLDRTRVIASGGFEHHACRCAWSNAVEKWRRCRVSWCSIAAGRSRFRSREKSYALCKADVQSNYTGPVQLFGPKGWSERFAAHWEYWPSN